jgi:hypothetical protein
MAANAISHFFNEETIDSVWFRFQTASVQKGLSSSNPEIQRLAYDQQGV